ncbi:transcription termination factor MTERF8, chloroplastic-like [Triticum dicoccoides]|uniref:transcription termination factor MTERF8, chloroplastic-like n=1 Tax=Triticum dicoccoides TaxID=85692 RepID=UPI001891E601|nr:transcription termination factor MTERF8, chloroplastic-like [Triticum dicoccoides]XP_037452857.1 transcription termination factor MTERF8, chloroplastic-like [Triticum dicoccoides]XP_037452858.1 transcription termination factor MTERF8, chloroplastic-like [Triticum dicoccoides]
MLHLRQRVLSRLLSAAPSPSTSPLPSLRRLLSAAAAPRISPNPSFAVEEYLVSTCGLSRAHALKASAKLSHLKSPSKPDAVLAFLAGLGLSGADVAAVVAKDPRFLCAGVERTLSPVLAGLTGLGLSPSDIVRFVLLVPDSFRQRCVVSKLEYYLPLFGSIDNMVRPLKYGPGFLDSDLERVVKPKVKLLAECGLGACDIAKLFIQAPMILGSKPERFVAMVACAEGIGVPRGSGMFRQALYAVSCFSEDKIAAKLDYLKKTLRWSDAEVGIAVSKGPFLLRRSNDVLQRLSEFLICEVGLEPTYIAHQPTILSRSLEGRLSPRYYVMRFLKENGLLKHGPSYCTIVKWTEKKFLENFICPHKEAAPYLAEDYAAACKGQVPGRFRFT